MSDLDRPEHDDQPNMPSRRDFLRVTAAGAALVGLGGKVLAAPDVAGAKPKFDTKEGDDAHTGMLYRAIPACEIRLSVIGCNPAGDEPLRRMVQLGCNWFHKLDGCGSREFRQSLDWSKLYCDVVIDHVAKQEAIDEFEARRKNAGVDVIDFFKIHSSLTKPEQLKTVTSIFEAFETVRDQGKTRWLATSLHAGGPEMVDACIEDGRFKMIQIPFNPPGSNDVWLALLKKAQAAGIATVSMKSMAGGPTKWAESEAAKAVLQHYFDQGASPAVAMLRWNLAQPGVTSIVPDSPNVKIAEENCSAAGAKLTAWEREGVERFASAMSSIWCRSCRTCEGSCPRVLPIPDLLRYRMYSKDYGNVAGARKLYAALDESRRASACIDCGECERACPYGLNVRDFLADAHRRLS